MQLSNLNRRIAAQASVPRPSSRCGKLALRAAVEALETRRLLTAWVVTSASDSGVGSLRYEIAQAEQALGSQTITFANSGSVNLSGATIDLSTIGDDTFGPSALAITGNITIDGGSDGIILTQDVGKASPTGGMRLFYVTNTGSLTLEDLTLTGGLAQGGNGFNFSAGAAGMGGAVVNAGTLDIIDSTLAGNNAQGGNGDGEEAGSYSGGGGGLSGSGGGGTAGGPNADGGFGGGGAGEGGNAGFGGGGGAGFLGTGGSGGFGGGGGGAYGGSGGSGGFAGGNGSSDGSGGGGAGLGGAVFNYGGTVNITNSTLAANSALGGGGGQSGQGLGGAIFNLNGSVTTTFATLADNTAAQGGGAVYNLGDSGIATQSGPSLPNNQAQLIVNDSILAGSNDGRRNAVSDVYQQSPNLSASTSGANDIIEEEAQPAHGSGLQYLVNESQSAMPAAIFATNSLANNGGPTETLALQANSPAIGAGIAVNGITTDQRGVTRPATPAIGAYQNPVADLTITVTDNDGGSSITNTTGSAFIGSTITYTIFVTNSGPSDAPGTEILDDLPAGISSDVFNATGTGGASGFTLSGSGNIADSASLPSGSSIIYEVVANISDTATGTLTNTASLTPGNGVTDTNSTTSATDSDTLIQATPGVTAIDPSGVYNGLPFTASASVLDVNNNPLDTSGVMYTSYTVTFTGVGAKSSTASPGTIPTLSKPTSIAPTDAGNYAVIAYYPGNTDYMAEYSGPTYFTISQAPATINLVANSATYNGVAYSPTVSVTGLNSVNIGTANNLTIQYFLQSDVNQTNPIPAPTDVGAYQVVVTFSGTQDYAYNTASTTFSITPASLTVTGGTETAVYGGTIPALTYTYTGAVAGGTTPTFTGSVATTATSLSNVNSYAITQGSLAATGNYTIGQFNAGSLSITPASLTVTGGTETAVYGSTLPALTYTYTGTVVGGTTPTFIGSLSAPATSLSDVNSYAINP